MNPKQPLKRWQATLVLLCGLAVGNCQPKEIE
jgi:hypothetical protein